MSLYLGFDTSNYTTSVALYDPEQDRVWHAKRLLPVKPGEKGIRQSDAVFHHTQQLPELLETVLTDAAEAMHLSRKALSGEIRASASRRGRDGSKARTCPASRSA